MTLAPFSMPAVCDEIVDIVAMDETGSSAEGRQVVCSGSVGDVTWLSWRFGGFDLLSGWGWTGYLTMPAGRMT